MIQVKWELEGGDIDEAAAEAAVKSVLNYYKQALAGVSCPDHGGMPLLPVRGRTVAGLRVSVAPGAEATRLWRESTPDLVIVDIFMPDRDGIETIRELRAHNPSIPIIAMSGGGCFQRVNVLEAAKRLGAVATIAKPFDNQTMINLVARSLAGAP